MIPEIIRRKWISCSFSAYGLEVHFNESSVLLCRYTLVCTIFQIVWIRMQHIHLNFSVEFYQCNMVGITFVSVIVFARYDQFQERNIKKKTAYSFVKHLEQPDGKNSIKISNTTFEEYPRLTFEHYILTWYTQSTWITMEPTPKCSE